MAPRRITTTPDPHHPSDEALVARAQDQDSQAFTTLYERYFPVVYRRTRCIVPEPDIEDIVQEVFMSMLTSLSSIDNGAQFGGWIRTLTSRRVADYFSHGLEGTVVQNLYSSQTTGKPTITIATPLLEGSGEVGGVLAAHLNLERMDAILAERTGLGRTSETYIMNREGQFATAAGFGTQAFPAAVHSEGIDAAVAGNDGSGLYLNYAGAPVVSVYRWLDNLNMALLAELQQSEAAEAARQLALSMFLVGLVLAGVIAAGIYLLARQITRPILAIADAAGDLVIERFEYDNLETVAQRDDEVGLLARAFQQMAREVYARERRLKQQVQELRIEIDEVKRERQVTEITESDYFQQLQEKARQLRNRESDQTSDQ